MTQIVHARFGCYAVVILLSACVLGSGTPDGPGDSPARGILAISIESATDADKPIAPIILAEHRPTAEMLRTMLVRLMDEHVVNTVLLRRRELDHLSRQLRAWLTTAEARNASDDVAFVRLTISNFQPRELAAGTPQVGQQARRALNRESAAALFRRLEDFHPKETAAAAALKEALDEFKQRMNLQNQP